MIDKTKTGVWQPFYETDECDSIIEMHVRGVWVTHINPDTKVRVWNWEAYCGYVSSSEDDFVNKDGESFGWKASDYSHILFLPPSPPPQEMEII